MRAEASPSANSASRRGVLLPLLTATIACALVAPYWWTPASISIGDDSLQYHQVAVEIRNGTFFTPREVAAMPFGAVIRTPGFPLILSLGEALAPDSPRHSALIPHTLLLMLLIAFLSTHIGGRLPSLLSVVAISVAMLKVGTYFGKVATEWSAFVFSIALIAASSQYLRERNPRSLFWVGLLVAITVLVRPALLFLVAIPVVLPLFAGRRVQAYGAVLLGALPLFLWLAFNYTRFHQVSVAPVSGYGLIYAATLVGGADAERFDDAATRQFALHYNPIKPEFDDAEIVGINRIPRPDRETLTRKYHTMVKAFFDAGARLGVDYVRFNQILTTYSVEAIRQHPERYLRHLTSALRNISVPILALLALLSLYLLWRTGDRLPIAYATLAAFFHTGVIGLSALVQPIDPRYYALSVAVPYFFIAVLLYQTTRAALLRAEDTRMH